MSKKRFLTLKQLKKMGACGEAIDAFQDLFDTRATLGAVLAALRALPEASSNQWGEWLLVTKAWIARALLEEAKYWKIPVEQSTLDSALDIALYKNRTDVAKVLLDAGARLPKDIQTLDFSDLDLSIVKLLIKAGWDIHTGREYALFSSLIYGEDKITNHLLDSGADPMARGPERLRCELLQLGPRSKLYKRLATYLPKEKPAQTAESVDEE